MSSLIYDPFVVTNLPRLQSKSDISKLCFTSQINDSNSSNFDITISGSYIATFITRPSPKMIWSYALSPDSIITAMDSYDLDLNTDNERKLFAVNINERKNYFIKFIDYGNNNNKANNNNNNKTNIDDENQSSSTSVVNEEDRHIIESNDNLKHVNDKTIQLNDEIIGLKFSNSNSNYLFALFKNGKISVLHFSTDEEINKSNIENLSFNDNINSNNQILYHQFIKPEQLSINSKSQKVDNILLIVEKVKNSNKLNVRLVSLNLDEILEISNSEIIVDDYSKLNNIQFTFDISGKLVILKNTDNYQLLLESYELPLINNKKIINITGVFQKEPKESPTSIKCASTNRILITKGSTVSLIDIKYESLLSSLDLYSRSKENNNGFTKTPRNATLLNVPIVNGNTIKSKNTFALLVLKNSKENISQIHYISIDVGLGKLRDALTPLPPNEEEIEIENENSFITFQGYLNDDDEEDQLIKNETENLNDTIEKINQLKENNDVKGLENVILGYLKNLSIEKIEKNNKFEVFESEKDKFVDFKLVKFFTLILFEYLNEDEEYIPERGITYFLTHPLFPIDIAHGLISKLKLFPRLQRQAIVTCVNIPSKDLIIELNDVENDEIFKDIIKRLIEEFSTEKITNETIKIIKSENSKFDLDKIINNIIKLNFGYEILNSFIDSNGMILSLHYSNDSNKLNKLTKQSQLKIDSLLKDHELLTLIDQALKNVEIVNSHSNNNSNKKSNKKKREEREIGDLTVGMSGFDMMMKFDTDINKRGSSNGRSKVTTYTIDRLTI